MTEGIRAPNLPLGSSISEFLGLETVGAAKSVKRFSRASVLGAIEAITNSFSVGGGVIFTTLSQALANLTYAANQMAWVIQDATPANNGVYQKTGASGSGSWARLGDLPYSFYRALNEGAGTANAIQATNGYPMASDDALIVVNITDTNTATPVTLSLNGGTPLTIKTASGNDPAVGGLITDMMVAGYIDANGTQFRMLSDQASLAIQTASESAMAAAETARDLAIEASDLAATVGAGDVPTCPSVAIAKLSAFPATRSYLIVAGYSVHGDTPLATYTRSATEPSHPGKFRSTDRFMPDESTDSTNGGWWTLVSTPVHCGWLGAKGDGTSFDEDALNNARLTAVALGTYVDMPAGTFVVRANKTGTGLNTGARNYALDLGSNSWFVGIKGKTTIKMADDQSTDAAPKDVNIFMATSAMTNIGLTGIIFDCNGANNLMSPDRGSGVYNRYCSGSINITGDEAWVDGLYILDCEFNNCPGTNQIVTGQSANDFAGPLSQNVYILRNKFYNNGLDTDDHSAVYSWGEKCWALDNVFSQSGSLDRTGKNWVALEIHGAHTWFCRNRVENYYRGCWIASNFTSDSVDLHIEDNSFKVFGNGPSLFRQLSTLTYVGNVYILNNTIELLDGVSLSAQRIGISIVVEYAIGNIFIRGNSVAAAGTGYDSQMVNIGVGAGAAVKQVHITDNYAEGVVTGVYARTNDGDGLITDVHESGNTYVNLGSTDTSLASAGSRYQYTGGSGIGAISCLNNKYLDRAGLGNFDLGINLIGLMDAAHIDGNEFVGMVSFPSGSPYSIDASGATITRRVGRQICSGTAAPTSGTWRPGEEFHNFAPTKAFNVDKWKFGSDSAWRAFGSGYGTTAQRPSSGLTTSDAGYSYYDTTLAKMIMWDGASWTA